MALFDERFKEPTRRLMYRYPVSRVFRRCDLACDTLTKHPWIIATCFKLYPAHTALRGLRSGQPAVGLGVLRLLVLPRVQRSAPRLRSAHQVRRRVSHGSARTPDRPGGGAVIGGNAFNDELRAYAGVDGAGSCRYVAVLRFSVRKQTLTVHKVCDLSVCSDIEVNRTFFPSASTACVRVCTHRRGCHAGAPWDRSVPCLLQLRTFDHDGFVVGQADQDDARGGQPEAH